MGRDGSCLIATRDFEDKETGEALFDGIGIIVWGLMAFLAEKRAMD